MISLHVTDVCSTPTANPTAPEAPGAMLVRPMYASVFAFAACNHRLRSVPCPNWRRLAPPEAEPRPKRMTARILIIDDVPANTRLLEAKLSAEYYQVASGRDGFEALQLAGDWQPDLILLDVMMPGMDGFECCRQLKESAATRHIPVVMITAL